MNVIGKIKVLNETQNVTASFKKRELVVTTDEQYPQHIQIEFAQDKCDVLNGYKVGDSVDVSINLRGREWTNPQGEVKYFNQIQYVALILCKLNLNMLWILLISCNN